MAWSTPKTDWDTNPISPTATDFNRIESNIDFLNDDIETKKGLIVDAINDMGRTVTIANTHAELATAIKDISDDANAVVGDVLLGKTFYSGGIKKTGTIPSKSDATITPGTTNQVIAANQYLSGAQTILGDADLIAANIRSGINLFNVVGTLPVNIFTASDDVIASFSNTISSIARSYTKAAELAVGINGTIRLRFTLYTNTEGSPNGYCKIYVNGVAVSQEFYTTSQDGLVCNVDLTVKSGDLIQFYMYRSGYAVAVKSISIRGKVNNVVLVSNITEY